MASRQVSGYAGHRHGVGPVRVDLQVVEHVGAELQGLGQGSSQLVVSAQDQDALTIGTQADLIGRAEHPVGPLAAHLASGNLHAVGHRRPQGGQRNEVAHRHVERPAADLQRLTIAGVDVH